MLKILNSFFSWLKFESYEHLEVLEITHAFLVGKWPHLQWRSNRLLAMRHLTEQFQLHCWSDFSDRNVDLLWRLEQRHFLYLESRIPPHKWHIHAEFDESRLDKRIWMQWRKILADRVFQLVGGSHPEAMIFEFWAIQEASNGRDCEYGDPLQKRVIQRTSPPTKPKKKICLSEKWQNISITVLFL